MIRLRKLLLSNKLYLFIFICSLLYFVIDVYLINHNSIYTGNEDSVTGIISEYNIDGNSLTLIIDSKESIKGTYNISSIEEKNELINSIKYGIEIKINGELKEPINNTIPNTFNYKKYLNNHHIYYLMEIDDYEITNSNESFLLKIKNYLIKRIKTVDKNEYILTFVMGNKNSMTSNTLTDYQVLGISHLFAISGMHVSLFATILLFILKKLKIYENKRYLIVIIFLFFYAFLVNFTPSVLRSVIFFTLLSLNKIFYTNIKTINLFLLTVSILIIINPFILLDIGAQYSILTSLGLILFSEKLTGNYLISLIKVSSIAFLFSLPITAINFFKVNLLTIFNNLLFVPLITFIIYPLSLITMIFTFLNSIYSISVNIMEFFVKYLSNIELNILLPKCNIIIWLIYYLLIYLYYKNNKKLNLIFIGILLLVNRYKYLMNDNYYVYFLDVGQGDSSLLISPYQKEIIMIDTGGRLEYEQELWEVRKKTYINSSNIITLLNSLGIKSIDLLIVSHGDDDHAGEVLNISKKINIKNVYLNNYDNDLESNIRNHLNVVNNYQSKVFNYQIINNKNTDENKDSLITYFNINNYKFLYMGDASKSEELTLIKKYNLDIDIIKLGHHGSKTSSDKTFLKSINPSLAIISAGRENRFGHPHKHTISTLKELNIKNLNTQDSGTIIFIIHDKSIIKKINKP